MDLINRYLHAVKSHLPLRQQDDLVAELGDDLRSRVEDRESELGRPLTDEEVAGILKPLGRPLVMASKYGRRDALIGQTLLPYFWQTVKVALGIALLVQVVVTTVMLVSGQPTSDSLRGLISFPFVTAPTLFGWMAVVFFVLDRNIKRLAIADTWDPRTLPAVPRDGKTPSRVPVVGDLIGLVSMLAWWLLVPAHPFFLLGPAAAFLVPGPGWHASYVPVASLMLVAIGLHAVALIKPALRLPTRIGAHTLALVGLGLLATSGDLLVPALDKAPADLANVILWIDRSVGVGLAVVSLIIVIELGRDLWRVLQARRLRAVAATASTLPGSPR